MVESYALFLSSFFCACRFIFFAYRIEYILFFVLFLLIFFPAKLYSHGHDMTDSLTVKFFPFFQCSCLRPTFNNWICWFAVRIPFQPISLFLLLAKTFDVHFNMIIFSVILPPLSLSFIFLLFNKALCHLLDTRFIFGVIFVIILIKKKFFQVL